MIMKSLTDLPQALNSISLFRGGGRRPFFLAIAGVSIVVSAVAIGATLTRYLSLRSYSPKAPPVSFRMVSKGGTRTSSGFTTNLPAPCHVAIGGSGDNPNAT